MYVDEVNANFHGADSFSYKASDGLVTAIDSFANYIATETLASSLVSAEEPAGDFRLSDEFEGEALTVAIRRHG